MELSFREISEPAGSTRYLISQACGEMVDLIRESAGDAPHETVHELRKQMKKIRAVLRLVRDTTEVYAEWNVFFRDLGRMLSDLRDAQAHLEALDMLFAQYGDKIYKNALGRIRNKVRAYRGKLREETLEQDRVLEKIRVALESRCGELKDLPMSHPGPFMLTKGVRRTYKRGRNAFEHARESTHPEILHEWRKRVKYLRYQLLAVQEIWPAWTRKWEDELHRLSDFLGADRDLFELNEFLEAKGIAASGKPDAQLVAGLIAKHRHEMQQHALLLGARLYDQAPDTFRELLRTCWQATLREKELALSPAESLMRQPPE